MSVASSAPFQPLRTPGTRETHTRENQTGDPPAILAPVRSRTGSAGSGLTRIGIRAGVAVIAGWTALSIACAVDPALLLLLERLAG